MANELFTAGLAIESKSKMLYSLLELMRLSLPEAEEDDMEKCLRLAAELAGDISTIHQEAVKTASQKKGGGTNA